VWHEPSCSLVTSGEAKLTEPHRSPVEKQFVGKKLPARKAAD
jgi:hypothetical protein